MTKYFNHDLYLYSLNFIAIGKVELDLNPGFCETLTPSCYISRKFILEICDLE